MAHTTAGVADVATRRTSVRWYILALIFIVTSINYADRSTMAIAGPAISKELGLTAADMGVIFSAFGWAYVVAQIPGGWMLDRYGSRVVYAVSLTFWSLFTLLQGFVGFFSGGAAVLAFFALRLLVGCSESPAFPGNSRIVAAWFPRQERATAAAIFNAAQYFSTVIFAPIMGWVTYRMGWPWIFFMMGVIGFFMTFWWLKTIHDPSNHPKTNKAEVDYIAEGGGLVSMDEPAAGKKKQAASWNDIRQLFSSRMLLGIFLGQFCINGITYFFITWFPVYLVQARGMNIMQAGFVASLPAICGFAGGLLGGVVSDLLLRRGLSLTAARKIPIILGMLCSMSMMFCNYTDTQWIIVAFMSLAFFGKGFGALGWAVMSDCAPKELTGVAGGVFNMCGNIASITTPLVIGYIIQITGNFHGALLYVALNGLLAAFSYLVIVGPIKRLQIAH